MADYIIKAEKRDTRGKSAARKLRAAGKVPAVVYGSGVEAVSLAVDAKALSRIVEHGAEERLVKLETGDTSVSVILKDVRREPLKGGILHVDFHQVAMDKKLNVVVSVLVVGEGARKADHGVLAHGARELDIACLPSQIPEHIEVDISGLVIGDAIRAGEATLPAGVELVSDPDTILVSIMPPAKAEEEAPAEAAAAPEADEKKAE